MKLAPIFVKPVLPEASRVEPVKDVTKDLTQADRWTIHYKDRLMVFMPHDKRFDYELKLTPEGIRVIARPEDEGKVG